VRRRDFLNASLGIGGMTLSPILSAIERPCAPEILSVQGGSRVTTPCGGPLSPEWFNRAPALTWLEIAGGQALPASWQRGANIIQRYNEDPGALPGTSRPTAITSAESGACVDQAGKEFLMVANGGHGDGYGNEGYALALATDVPGWIRLNDRTPMSHGDELLIEESYSTEHSLAPAVYRDGRSRAMHTIHNQTFANQRVWFPMQNSVASKQGNSNLHVVAFNRELVRGREPLAWSRNNIEPWEFYGPVGFDVPPVTVNSTLAFGSSAYDERTGLIWYLPKNSRYYWSVVTSGPNIGKTQVFDAGTAWKTGGEMWSAMCPTLGIMIVGVRSTHSIYVFVPDLAGSTGARLGPFQTSTQFGWGNNVADGFAQHWGAVFLRSTSSLLLYNSDRRYQLGQRVRRLQIPVTSAGKFDPDPNRVWQWTEHGMGGVEPIPGDSVFGTFSRFNLVEDMDGLGNQALVLCTGIRNPTYVCKIPAGAI
jgi:hypothetical protein